MNRFVLAATGLALTSSLALAQTATDTTTTDATAPAAATTTTTDMNTDATTPAADATATDATAAADGAAAEADKAAADAADAAAAADNAANDATDTTTTTTTGGTDTTAAPMQTTTETPAATGETLGTDTDTMTTTAPATTDATAPAVTTDVAEPGDVVTPVQAPDVNPPAISEQNPGMLGSWLMNRRIWTTNQPSSTEWQATEMTERPADWNDIAKVDDLVVDGEGNLLGYVADIGGFLGIGAKKVLLGKDALHFVRVGDDSFFATNFTKEELKALPDFDTATVMR